MDGKVPMEIFEEKSPVGKRTQRRINLQMAELNEAIGSFKGKMGI